jgi:DNA-binding CsgD family transcriptional regulator/tetratricopeptide (TPR) repeat protein
MRLLERASPLGSLAACVAEARRGDGRLVLVAGEAGVGKSALVEQLQRDVLDAHWSWGACDGLFTPRPLGPLFDLADQLGGELLGLCQAGAAREELFRALLRQVSEPGTLNIVVVEDIHWADEATIDLLRFLGRRIQGAPVLLIATYRDDGLAAGDPLLIALGNLVRQRSTRRVRLAPLSADAVGVLAGGSGLEAAALYRLTGGNPFYVTEVLQAGTEQIPASARDAVLAHAAQLGGEARNVLDVAALIGARVELRLLDSVTACPPSAVDELLACGLLTGDGAWLRFRHEIARLAVQQAIAAHRSGTIHSRVLAALHDLGCADDAQMAFHAEAAADGPAVLRHAPAAARRAAELASHREAAAQFERALRFAGGAGIATVAGLYDGLAAEVSLLDRWQESADASERALGLWREAGDRLREGGTMRQLSRAMANLARGSDAAAAAGAAVAILEPLGPGIELAWAYANLANQQMLSGEGDAAIEMARRAQAVAGPLGAPEVISDALNTEGCAAFNTGREWIGQLRDALRIAISEGLEAQAGRAYCNIQSMHCSLRQFGEAEQAYLDGIAYCDEHDIATYATFLRSGRTNALERTGRWDEALAMGGEILDLAAPSPIIRLCPLSRIGMILARRGEPGAWECLDEAMQVADGTGEPQQIVPVRLARAEAYWLTGKPADARREAELADDGSAGCDAWQRGALAVWLRRTGSARTPHGELAGPYQRKVEGDWEKAAQLWTDLGCPYEAAMALVDAPEEAALRECLRILTGLGAAAVARIGRQRMRALGVRSIPAGPRTATRAHPKQLTRRESEVLDLICAGHTNAAISAELFISAKTVDHHVSAILAKLGAPNRNAAAAQAARLGLVGGAGAAGNAGLRSPCRRAAADLRCRARGWPPLPRPWRDTRRTPPGPGRWAGHGEGRRA